MSVILTIIWLGGCVAGIQGCFEYFPKYWKKNDLLGLICCIVMLAFWIFLGFTLLSGSIANLFNNL